MLIEDLAMACSNCAVRLPVKQYNEHSIDEIPATAQISQILTNIEEMIDSTSAKSIYYLVNGAIRESIQKQTQSRQK